jgi:hypothetical protein
MGALFLGQEARYFHSSHGFQARIYLKIPAAQGYGSFWVQEFCNGRMSIDEAEYFNRKRTSNHSCDKRRLHIELRLSLPLSFQVSAFSEDTRQFSLTEINS